MGRRATVNSTREDSDGAIGDGMGGTIDDGGMDGTGGGGMGETDGETNDTTTTVSATGDDAD